MSRLGYVPAEVVPVAEVTAMAERLPTIDPAGMSRAQLAGKACASCAKSWPAPTVVVGRFPDGRSARCCPECWPTPDADERPARGSR